VPISDNLATWLEPTLTSHGGIVAILKKRLHLDASLYTILQILSLTLFERMPVSQPLAQLPPPFQSAAHENRQCLLGFLNQTVLI